jgi:hypothetical protein
MPNYECCVEFIVNDLTNCLLIIFLLQLFINHLKINMFALLSLDYILLVEYNLTPSGRSVNHRVISLNGVGDLKD